MSTLSIAIIIVFCIGYFFIAIESVTKINKAAIALLMFVATWTLFMIDPGSYIAAAIGEMKASAVSQVIEHHLGSTGTTLFFLMGAMTIVELVDQNGGFNFVRDTLQTTSKRALLWRIACMTFILSAILDNLTTSIVMIMILRKLVSDQKDRLIYASLVVIAANSGGAFSPIGDVTTIMLWNKGVITAAGVIMEIFIPSVVSMVIPAYILSLSLKGKLEMQQEEVVASESDGLSDRQRKTIFFLGVGGLIFVPIFKTITHLPPFVGILLVLGVLWTVTEIFYTSIHQESEDTADNSHIQKRVSKMLSRIDMDTILFFLGILMAVSCLKVAGILGGLANGLDSVFGTEAPGFFFIDLIIGVLSSVVDNVPLVAAAMGMYPFEGVDAIFIQNHPFWEFLAYCAGTGGSLLIIGSAAGVAVMGMEKIDFIWYLKKISWLALTGYIAGAIVFMLMDVTLFEPIEWLHNLK